MGEKNYIDNAQPDFVGDKTIESIVQGKERGDDIQQSIDDIKNAIKGTISFETELGAVGQIEGMLAKMKSGVISIAELENLLKQASELKKSVEINVANISKFERISERQKSNLDGAINKSSDFLDLLRDVGSGLSEERQAELMQDTEKIRRDTEYKKMVLLPFIGELLKKLEQTKECEINMVGLVDNIQVGLIERIRGGSLDVVQTEAPQNKVEDPMGLIEKIQRELEKQVEAPSERKEYPGMAGTEPETEKTQQRTKERGIEDEPETRPETEKAQQRTKEKQSAQLEHNVEDLGKAAVILSTNGLLELLDDHGKTPEFQNILEDSRTKSNLGDSESKAYNKNRLDNSSNVAAKEESLQISEKMEDIAKKSDIIEKKSSAQAPRQEKQSPEKKREAKNELSRD